MENWTTTYTTTEQVEDPNPEVWIIAAKNSKTKDDALYKIKRACYYAKKQDEISLLVKSWLILIFLWIKFNIIKILAFIVFVLLLIICALLLHKEEKSNSINMRSVEIPKEQVSTMVKQTEKEQETVIKYDKLDKKIEGNEITKARNILNQYGYVFNAGELRCTTYGNNSEGFLSVVGNKLIVVDLRNRQIAEVNYSKDLIQKIGEFKKGTVYFNLKIKDDSKDEDASNGGWIKGDHYMPIKVEYTRKSNTELEPGMIKSCYHNKNEYDQYLQEQKNVDLVNLIVTEMPVLRKNYYK